MLMSAEGEVAEQSLGPIHHKENKQTAIQCLPHIGGNSIRHSDKPEHFRDTYQERCADDGTPQAACSADDHYREHENGFHDGKACRVDVACVVGIEASAYGCSCSGDNKDRDLVFHHVLAHGHGEYLVFPDGLEHPPERRIDKTRQK